jgi:hypothetical protein
MKRHRDSVLAGPGQITGDEFLGDHFAQLDIRVPAHAGARQLGVTVFRTFQVVEGSLGNQLSDRRYQGFGDFLVHEGFRLKDPHYALLAQRACQDRIGCCFAS